MQEIIIFLGVKEVEREDYISNLQKRGSSEGSPHSKDPVRITVIAEEFKLRVVDQPAAHAPPERGQEAHHEQPGAECIDFNQAAIFNSMAGMRIGPAGVLIEFALFLLYIYCRTVFLPLRYIR